MPNWGRIAERLSTLPTRRPVMTSLLGAGVGAAAAGALAPEERRRQIALLGAGAGAAAGLIHPGVRRAIANAARRTGFAYTGKAPKSFKGTAEEYLKSIQPHKIRHPEVSLSQRAWEGLRRAVRRPAKELKPTDRMADVVEKHRLGLSSIPGRIAALRKDPKEFARQWWQHGGKTEAMWAPLWMGSEIVGARGQPPEERRKALGSAIGGTMGWMAASGMPAGVWMPTSMAAGYLGKRIAGIGTGKTKKPIKEGG